MRAWRAGVAGSASTGGRVVLCWGASRAPPLLHPEGRWGFAGGNESQSPGCCGRQWDRFLTKAATGGGYGFVGAGIFTRLRLSSFRRGMQIPLRRGGRGGARRGIRTPTPYAGTRPSTWRVCQFRHPRCGTSKTCSYRRERGFCPVRGGCEREGREEEDPVLTNGATCGERVTLARGYVRHPSMDAGQADVLHGGGRGGALWAAAR